MLDFFWPISKVAEPFISAIQPAEWALLALLAVSVMLLSGWRDRYWLMWTAGWAMFTASRLVEMQGATWHISERRGEAAAHALFVLAVGGFAGAIFAYVGRRRLLAPLAGILLVCAAFAVTRAFLWPGSLPLRFSLEVAYRIILLTAAACLLYARRGRREPATWMLAIFLLTLHLEWNILPMHVPSAVCSTWEVMFGTAMLLVVFREAAVRTRRLNALTALSNRASRTQQQGDMMNDVLNDVLLDLQKLVSCKTVWFRSVQGSHLVTTHAVGVSRDFLREMGSSELTEDLSRNLERGLAHVVAKPNAGADDKRRLTGEKLEQLVIVPVLGQKSVVGILVLGSAHRPSSTAEEMEFLESYARQLGVAIENFKLLEQVLRSQGQWRNTFDSVHDIILAHDAGFRVIKANQTLLEQLQQSSVEVIGKNCETVLPRSFGKWSGCPYCARSEEEVSEGIDPCFGGFSLVSTSSYSEQGGAQKGTIHIVRDITARRSAEEKYRLLFDQVQEGVYVATPKGRLLDCNDALVHMLGYESREELLARNLDEDIRADAGQREAFHQEIQSHEFVRNFESTLRHKNGSLLLVAESSFAQRESSGTIERLQGFVLDVTEKRRAEEEMRRRNRELNALNAMAVVATQSFDLDEILNLTLRQVVSLFGTESGTVYLADSDTAVYRRRATWGPLSRDRSRPAEVNFSEGFGDLVMRSRAEVLTAEYLPHLSGAVAEFVRPRMDGAWIWVLFWGKEAPIGMMGLRTHSEHLYSSGEENLLVAISRQLATTIEKVRLYEETCKAYEDLRRTQEQLLQSEKMSAVGQLIAGVAHELNNPLTAILGYAQLIESEVLNERARDYVAKMFKQAQRTHRVVQNLLSFARQRKPERHEVDLRKVVDEAFALRDFDLKVNHIAVEKDVQSQPAMVVADPHQLEQVFLNIINNAVDAILETGRPGRLKVRLHSDGGSVAAQIADDGPGIKDPKKIFDPFYTTKSVGKGTGLGLSICYGIVKEHGGDIVAHNAAEGGAVLEVRLPEAPTAGAAIEKIKIEIALPQREGAIQGRILLVEEDESVLEFEHDVLAGAGAEVVTVANSDDAKTRLLSESFDAVIISGRMPGDWTAKEAHAWITARCVGIDKHILFTFSNGLEQSDDDRTFLRQNEIPFLVKPFEVGDLICEVRRLLWKAKAATASAT